MDLREIGINGANWMRLAQDRFQWRAFVKSCVVGKDGSWKWLMMAIPGHIFNITVQTVSIYTAITPDRGLL